MRDQQDTRERISICPIKITDSEFHYEERLDGALVGEDYWLIEDAERNLKKVTVEVNTKSFLALASKSRMMTTCYGSIIKGESMVATVVIYNEDPQGNPIERPMFSFTRR
ncbi:MAG: hypothetical protein KUG73_07095 [Pseudomonadales bacterium]|nr:hypothetical protein [Pseudomonadales bacterium]